MSHRSRRDRERDLEALLEGAGTSSAPDAAERREVERLAAIAGSVGRLAEGAPDIDEQRVWLQVRAGMLAEPQRQRPVGLWSRILGFNGAPRLALASLALVVLVVGATATALLLQPTTTADAAFAQRVEEIASVSSEAVVRGTLTLEERAAIETEAFALLELASRPGVLSALGRSEASAVRERLIEARGALAMLLAAEPTEARAIAALAAISGLIEAANDPTAAARSAATSEPTSQPSAAPAAVVEVTAEPTVPLPARVAAQLAAAAAAEAAAKAAAEASSTPRAQGSSQNASPSPSASAQAARPSETRTPTSPTARATETPSPRAAATVGAAALASVRATCARVVDQPSLAKCAEAGAEAARDCRGEGSQDCRNALDDLVDTAEERLERVRESCRELPNSRARDACSDATRADKKKSGISYEAALSEADERARDDANGTTNGDTEVTRDGGDDEDGAAPGKGDPRSKGARDRRD